jgi:uncharacterized protein
MSAPLVEIPARKGKVAVMPQGAHIKVINTHGEQVVDTWAFNCSEPGECMSMEHTRAHTLRISPRLGDSLRTNRRRPIMTIIEDTSGGIHDTLIAACDRDRYALLGIEGYHDNCADNLRSALAELNVTPRHVPAPLNLFMNIPWDEAGGLRFAAPPQRQPGSYVVFRAEMDLIIAFSACPQDVLPINGRACRPLEAHFMML